MSKQIAIVSVINDLVSDQRVHRTAITLKHAGYEVLLVGRQRKASPELFPREYATHRMKLLYEKGPFFYAEYNIRLFFFLLLHKASLLVSNDLDTLLPNHLMHKLKNIPLVYDAHEYFTGVPELEHRPFVRKIWKLIERMIVPRLKNMVTVNDSMAELYQKEYGITPLVIRNIPLSIEETADPKPTRKDFNLPDDKRIILLQGAGININRGAEEAVLAMQYTSNALLLIIGDGDVLPTLKTMVSENDLQDKVSFIPRQSARTLAQYTSLADLGISLDKDTNINYRLSLPNKIFDYIKAGVPILASPLPEVKKIITRFNCGMLIENHDPQHIASCFNRMLDDPAFLQKCRTNAWQAAIFLDGEIEQRPLLNLFRQIKSPQLK